ncbi:MAG: hypothetical protein JSS66_01095 [Armatimonadetes bacterium]|nr:hypothetical protein [Armatimonadota bacterium]
MKETREDVIVLTRARFATLDLDRLSALRSRVFGVLSNIPGFISTSVWERHDDPFAIMTLGHFESEADSSKAWDMLMRSPVMEVLTDLMSDAPNTLRFKIRATGGKSLESMGIGQFCSLSTRIADPGYAPDMLFELETIFKELAVIPGFSGYVTGQLTEVEEEVIGMAFWDSKQAYDTSIPKKSMYRIDLYNRVL